MAKKSVNEAAATYLEHRMHTVSEMRDHLQKKEYEIEEIEEVIKDFISRHYLDDEEYAKRYFEYAFGKKRGSQRIKKELEKKGVSKKTIDNAYEDYIYENSVDEYEVALKIAKREIFGDSSINTEDMNEDGELLSERSLAKIARKLEQLGYRGDDIFRVLGEMKTWKC